MTNTFQSIAAVALALASLPATTMAKTDASPDIIIVSDVQAYPSEVVGNGEMRRPGEIGF
jgi:hypothetical protein